MQRNNPRAHIERLLQVLDEVAFPAAKWRLIMHAEQYGADAVTRTDLWALPAGDYPTLPDVLAALGLITSPSRRQPPLRPQPGLQAAARERPRH